MQEFIKKCGIENFKIMPLKQDASKRQYYRIGTDEKNYILMTGEATQNRTETFIKLSKFFNEQGIRAPKVLAFNEDKSFVLLEDLGDETFTNLLNGGADEEPLYDAATDILVKTARVREKFEYIPVLGEEQILSGFALFVDWYYPSVKGLALPAEKRIEFLEIVKKILPMGFAVPSALVLWDYHVDNLMKADDDCAVIDFQDACFAPLTYDIMSLIEDARRKIAEPVYEKMKKKFFESLGDVSREDFERSFAFFSIFRHLRVLGRFAELLVRQNKDVYLKHIPNLWRMVNITLKNPELKDLKKWMDENLPPEFRNLPRKKPIDKAIILAAGRGERMKHLTNDLPKPLIRVKGKTLLDYKLEMLRDANIKDVVVNVCYQKELIKKHLAGVNDFNVLISEEEVALETGGGVKKALPLLGENPFFTLNSDELWVESGVKSSMWRMMDKWDSAKMDILLLLTPLDRIATVEKLAGNYKISGDVIVQRNVKCVEGFEYLYIGVALVNPKIFENSPDGKFSMRDLYDEAMNKGRLFCEINEDMVYHVGTPGDLELAEGKF